MHDVTSSQYCIDLLSRSSRIAPVHYARLLWVCSSLQAEALCSVSSEIGLGGLGVDTVPSYVQSLVEGIEGTAMI